MGTHAPMRAAPAEASALVGAHPEVVPVTREREPLEAHLLATLSEACREKLAERRHHGDWRAADPNDLMIWLREEVRELDQSLDDYMDATRSADWERADRMAHALAAVRSECADVALLAGMILDCIERAPLRAGDTEAARWAERNRALEARLQAVREAAK